MIKEFFANYRLHTSDVTFDYGATTRAACWSMTGAPSLGR